MGSGAGRRRAASQAIVLLLGLLLVGVFLWTRGAGDATSSDPAPRDPAASQSGRDALPPQAREVLRRIEAGGPFVSSRDGSVFGNRERLLPARERGYYREYTVPTPGSADRGARRIVTGGDPVEVAYYTADHYASFTRIEGYP